jgi:hypothetical protein
MEWERSDDEELLLKVIEALPRLRKYRLSGPQMAFIERIEKMQVAQSQAQRQSLRAG